MNGNKPKKSVIGESSVMHVNKGFAIAVIALFMTVMLIFNFGWAGVIVADAVVDLAVNPIIKLINPDAREIDVMAVMNPPTSESEAAKVYAKFPSLDTDAIKGYFGAAFDSFPSFKSDDAAFPEKLVAWVNEDFSGAVEKTLAIVAETVENYPANVERWYNDHLPFRSIIYNANERADIAIEKDYSAVQNYMALQLYKMQYVYQVLDSGIPQNGGENSGGPQGPSVIETDRMDDFESLVDRGDETESEIEVDTEEYFEHITDESDEETFPVIIPMASDTEEFIPEFEDSDESEKETIPEFEDSGESEEETIPEFEESSESEEETVPEFVETDGDETGDVSCEHILGDIYVEKEPTCTEYGVAGYKCQICDAIVNREYVAMTAHVAGEETVVEKEPTCTEFGIIGYKCQSCDAIASREYTAKATHVAGEETVVEKDPTCTEFGIVGYKCQSCDAIASREYVAKAAHVAGEETVVEKEPTCTEFGIVGYKCQSCDAVASREYTAKAAHVAGEETVVEKEPTCTEFGIVGYKCQSCDAVASREYTAKAAHTKDSGVIEKEATCTEKGSILYSCTVCGKAIGRQYTSMKPHDYEVSYSTPPLCGLKYKEISTCKVCSDTKEKEIVKKHTSGSAIRTVEASYTSYGYTLISCADCGGQYRTNIKSKLVDTSFALPIIQGEKRVVMEGRFKWLFYNGDNSESYFCGTNLMSDKEKADSLAVLVQLDNLCKQKGIELQICIWPNKDQVYPEYVTWVPVTEEKRVDRFVKYVTENSDVKIIYPIAELKSAKKYYDTYLQYDTHWNCAGGFVGYQAMLKSLGLETTDIRDVPVFEYTGVETENIDPYYKNIGGDMIGLGQLSSSVYNGGHNYYVKYRPHIKTDTFSGANGASDIRHTTASNATYDMNFVMFADSYRVMQLGYLEKDFSDCYLAHRNQVNQDSSKEAILNADIIVIAAVERYDSDVINTARHIINILSADAQ